MPNPNRQMLSRAIPLTFVLVGLCLAAARTPLATPAQTDTASTLQRKERLQAADPSPQHTTPTNASAASELTALADAGDLVPCTSDADCADEDQCTDDLCIAGICDSQPICAADEECDDNNVCTIDECIDGCCETRPQCLGHDDCDENSRCVYNCCVRCPSCHEIRGVRSRCRRQWIRTTVNIRNEHCVGNSITLNVNGRMVDCDVKGESATCLTRGKFGYNDICVADPDCPDQCDRVWCGR